MENSQDIINDTLESGIPPVSLIGTAVYNGYNDTVAAYRTSTDVFTADYGALRGESDAMLDMIDGTEAGRKLTYRSIRHAIRSLCRINADRDPTEDKFGWISVRGSTTFLTQSGLYESVEAVLEDENGYLPLTVDPRQICVEFSPAVFAEDRVRIKRGIADLKALGIKTAVFGFGEDDFPVSALMDVHFDLVFISPSATSLTMDRNRPGALNSLISFLHSLGIECVADGVSTDDEIRELGKMEIMGVIPSDIYKGEFKFALEKKQI